MKNHKLSFETLKSIYDNLATGLFGASVGVIIALGPIERKTSFAVSHSKKTSNGDDEKIFEDIVMNHSLRMRMLHLSRAMENTKPNQLPFRNMMFYGPPGTGKTIVARELALKLGFDYCIVNGREAAAEVGTQGVSKIHKLFDYGERSKKGLCIVIDNAEEFLQKRNSSTISEAQRCAINALLSRTGDLSQDTVLVLTTNRPVDLDTAVIHRIDEVVEFPLPSEEERLNLLKLYLSKSGKDAAISDQVVRDAATKTEGLSGREIAILVAAVLVYSDPKSLLHSQDFQEILNLKMEERKQKLQILKTDL